MKQNNMKREEELKILLNSDEVKSVMKKVEYLEKTNPNSVLLYFLYNKNWRREYGGEKWNRYLELI